MTIGNGRRSVEISPEGGLMYWTVNKTGAASIKGTVVHPSPTVNNAVQLVQIGEADAHGVVYDGGVPDGGRMRIVFSGVAEVLFVNAATREYLARTLLSGDGVGVAGEALSEPMPVSPFATDKHFLEIGHILETKGAPGLAKVNLHFN